MVSEEADGCAADLDTSQCPSGMMVDDGLVANRSLERATLTRRTARKLQSQYSAATRADKPSLGDDSGGVFWTLVTVLLILALSNLALTFFIMGVLRLGVGMESLEFITSPRSMLKFFGRADLGMVRQHDGVISTYAGEPLSIIGDNAQVSIGVSTVRPSPSIHVSPHAVHLANVNKLQVVEPESGRVVFSSGRPSFGVPLGVRHLHVQRTQTHRVASPTDHDLDIRADSTIRVKGNEGVTMEGRTLEWNADQDIFLRSLNGSLVLDGGNGGIFVEVNSLPLAGPVDHSRDRGQYKLCVCHRPADVATEKRRGRGNQKKQSGRPSPSDEYLDEGSTSGRHPPSGTLPEGHLFRVPVPLDNMRRSREHQITCASFTNPCMMM